MCFSTAGVTDCVALLPKEWERRLVDLNVRALRASDIQWADMVFVTGHAGAERIGARGRAAL